LCATSGSQKVKAGTAGQTAYPFTNGKAHTIFMYKPPKFVIFITQKQRRQDKYRYINKIVFFVIQYYRKILPLLFKIATLTA
jgi:hypothetical protein